MTRGVGEATDQYLPSSLPGFRERRLYPLDGRPERAKTLASGSLRDGKAILYVPAFRQKHGAAQVFAEQLEEIGLDVELRDIADYVTTSAYLGRLGNPGEPWDLAQVLWTPDLRRRVRLHQPAARRPGGRRHRPGRLRRGRLHRRSCAARPDCGRSHATGLQRARARTRARCRSGPADHRDERGDPRLGARRPEVHAAAALARPDDGLPEALGRLHRHPHEPVGDDDARGPVSDLDRLNLSRHRIDAGDGPVAGVRNPDGAGADGNRDRLVPDRDRDGGIRARVRLGVTRSSPLLATQPAPKPYAMAVDRRPTLVPSSGPARNVGGLKR